MIQGFFATYNVHNIAKIQRIALTKQLELLQLKERLSQIRVVVFTLLGTQSLRQIEVLKPKIEADLKALNEDLREFDFQDDVLAQSYETYQKIIELHWSFETTSAYELIYSTSQEEYETIIGILDKFTADIETATNEVVRQSTQKVIWATLGLCVVALLTALGWANHLMHTIVEPLKQIVQLAQRLREGDLSAQISVTRYDEIGQLQTAMKGMIEEIQVIVYDLNTLTDATRNGELSVRADVSKHEGEFAHIMQGMNETLNAIIVPLNISAEYLDRIARGDLSDKITNEYKGDFNEIKQSLNVLIDAIETTTQIAEELSHGNVTTEVRPRSDQDRMMHALQSLITITNDTTHMAEDIANGNLDIKVEKRSEDDRLMHAMNAMIHSLKDVAEAAKTMANGNLTVEVNERSQQDTLMQALNAMLTKLNRIVLEVKAMAENMATSSRQMISIAEVLSKGVAQQAAAAEEASSSMEEMAANIRQNSDNAKMTEMISLKSAKEARQGGDAVSKTIKAMKGIEERLSLIREIAMQTNLLSLNATIEAAKAEDYGKGFAVVAAEVWGLAKRSREAADGIELLVKSCVEVSEEAGTILQRLVPNSEKTAELVQEIAYASSEQATGAKQINRAIQQLDTVIQENAATAERMVLSAKILSRRAEQLHTTMEFFTVRDVR